MFCFPNTGHVIILQENCFFQISSYSRTYLRIIYEKTKGQVPMGPLLGKQNIQAKEVYSVSNHNYNKILKSDWFSTALISALIGQFNRTVRVMPK